MSDDSKKIKRHLAKVLLDAAAEGLYSVECDGQACTHYGYKHTPVWTFRVWLRGFIAGAIGDSLNYQPTRSRIKSLIFRQFKKR